jgi:hypothetical protein
VAEIDEELIARALRWCADARHASDASEIRAALSPLSWDELLAARAVLADAPPASPLGPLALVELARGVAPEVAAARQQERDAGAGRVAGEAERPPVQDTPAAPEPGPGRRPRGRRKPKAAPLVIRRARDRAEPEPAPPRSLPVVEELFRGEGRSTLERLIRRHGGRRARIAAELAAGWRRGDGSPAGAEDLEALLESHGMRRAFERRERDEALHALRAAGGSLAVAATDLGVDAVGLGALLERVGGSREAEAIRAERRGELRRRATLGERARLVADDAPRLSDLGVLDEFEADLRARLPEHVRALRAAGEPSIPAALARTLALEPAPAAELVRRLGVDLVAPPAPREPGRPHPHPPRGADPRRDAPRPPRRDVTPRRDGPRPPRRDAPARRGPAGAPRTGATGDVRSRHRDSHSGGRPAPARGGAEGWGKTAGRPGSPGRGGSRAPGGPPPASRHEQRPGAFVAPGRGGPRVPGKQLGRPRTPGGPPPRGGGVGAKPGRPPSRPGYQGGGPRSPQGGPRSPRGGPRSPHGGSRSPRGGPRSPHGGPRSPRGGPRSPRGGPR